MRGILSITQRRGARSSSQIQIILTGLAALVLSITNLVPLLTAGIFLIYCFVIPALLLASRMLRHFANLRPMTAVLVSMPMLVPMWVVLLSLLWIPNRGFTAEHMTLVLACFVVLMTGLLVWRTPDLAGRQLVAFKLQAGTELLSFGAGLLIGLVAAVVMTLL